MEKIIEIQEDVKIEQGDKIIILEKGDKIHVLNERMSSAVKEFDRHLFGRLVSDAEYCIKTARTTKHLWTHPVSEFISKMRELAKLVDISDWGKSLKDIDFYERELLKIERVEIRKYGKNPWL